MRATLLTIVIATLAGALVVGCAQEEQLGKMQMVQTDSIPMQSPSEFSVWTTPKQMYQSTQVIPVDSKPGYFTASDIGQTFGVTNTTAGFDILPVTTVFQVGELSRSGLHAKIQSDYVLSLRMFPYAGSQVAPGMNKLRLRSAQDTESEVSDVFEINDFTTYWYLSTVSSPSQPSMFWMDVTEKAAAGSDGSLLIPVGMGSAVLFQ